MAFFEGGAKDSEQVHIFIGVINCAPLFTRQRVRRFIKMSKSNRHMVRSHCRSPKLTGD